MVLSGRFKVRLLLYSAQLLEPRSTIAVSINDVQPCDGSSSWRSEALLAPLAEVLSASYHGLGA